jgi:hypothetical protein
LTAIRELEGLSLTDHSPSNLHDVDIEVENISETAALRYDFI